MAAEPHVEPRAKSIAFTWLYALWAKEASSTATSAKQAKNAANGVRIIFMIPHIATAKPATLGTALTFTNSQNYQFSVEPRSSPPESACRAKRHGYTGRECKCTFLHVPPNQ